MPNRNQIAVAQSVTAPATSGWVMLFPTGSVFGRTSPERDARGPYRLSDMQSVISATRAYHGPQDIVIDYDHQSDYAAVPGVGGQAPAAGWIDDLEARADGLWGRVEWTPAATEKLAAREYRYLSPVFTYDAAGNVQMILRAGLTNSPALDIKAVASANATTEEDPDMDLAHLRKLLGLADKADETAIMSAIEKLQGDHDTLASDRKALLEAAGLKGDTKAADAATAIKTAVASAAAKEEAPDPAKFVPASAVADLLKEVNALKAGRAQDQAEVAVASAIESGKLVPALKDWALDLAARDQKAFEAYLGAAPAIMTAGATLTAQPGKDNEHGLTADELSICSAMGLDPKAFAENKKETTHGA